MVSLLDECLDQRRVQLVLPPVSRYSTVIGTTRVRGEGSGVVTDQHGNYYGIGDSTFGD